MNAAAALFRDNPGLLVSVLLLAIGGIVVSAFTLFASRSGTSLRPILFVGGLFALVALPQFAYHLGVATGAIPRRDLTWMPASERARAYGWVENEAALTTRDGTFADPTAVFGPMADGALAVDLRAAGAATPFARAHAAQMVVLPSDGAAIVARFADPGAAESAARAYAREAFGTWPAIGADGLRSGARPGGDHAGLACVGRTLVVVTGRDAHALRSTVAALGALRPGGAQNDPAGDRYWLYRPGVLPTLVVLLGALYVIAFFKGAAWAGTVEARDDAAAVGEAELRRRLLAIADADVPFTIVEEPGTRRLIATWRFADARWLDFARARRIRYAHRVVLEVDAAARTVRPTDQQSRFDASVGIGGASLEWSTSTGVTFFEVRQERVFGLQFDAAGRPQPRLDYRYRFDLQEMKGPLIDAVTRAGWRWRPTPWRGPTWLRWLTD